MVLMAHIKKLAAEGRFIFEVAQLEVVIALFLLAFKFPLFSIQEPQLQLLLISFQTLISFY